VHEIIVDHLLTWFSRHARPLPWRRTRDPYAIWISEIMLQQTQVATVLPYYERWIHRLPTLPDLAAAPPALLLKLWAGLGYYRRARNLHCAARLIRSRFHGRFPHRHHDLLQLPGIGPYTAGAICSIAFNQPTPILDGNVIRLLTRLFALPGDPRAQPLNAQLWELSRRLVGIAAQLRPARTRPCAQLNQALMELGALICTPRLPRCPQCPLQTLCRASQFDQPTAFPNPQPRPTATLRHFIVFIIRHDSCILVRRQPDSGWNAGLWAFPSVETADGRRQPETLLRQCHKGRVIQMRPLGQVKHSITRFRLLLQVHAVEIERRPRSQERDDRWCRPAELRRIALSGAHRKILSLAGL
jgi:A/G-specific adenine glycosylase